MLVIPCAGAATRFDGWTAPKPLLPYLGLPMVHHVRAMFPKDWPTLYIMLEKHREYTESFPIQPQDHIVYRREVSRGPTDSILSGLCSLPALDLAEPLWICNCDSVVSEEFSVTTGNNVLTVRGQNNPAFSYVQVNSDHRARALRVAEKKVISDLASVGVYSFESVEIFAELAAEQLAAVPDPTGNPEVFVAPLYQSLIDRGVDVFADILGPDALLSSGTPAQYLNLLSRMDVVPFRRGY